MKNTADFLDALRVKFDLPSDGALGRFLGITHRQQMSWYRNLRGTFDDEMSMRVADLLDTDPAYVVACMHHQRAKHEAEKKLWERIANLSIGIAATLIVVAILPTVTLPDHSGFNVALEGVHNGGYVYYVKSLVDYWPVWVMVLLLILRRLSLRQGRSS